MARTKMMLITHGKEKFVTGEVSGTIISNLKDAGKDGMTYDQLCKVAKVTRGSLYVLAMRLRKANLIKTERDEEGNSYLTLSDLKKINVENVQALA